MKEQTFKLILKSIVGAVVLVSAALALLIWYATKAPDLGSDFSLIYQDKKWTFSESPKKLNLLYIVGP